MVAASECTINLSRRSKWVRLVGRCLPSGLQENRLLRDLVREAPHREIGHERTLSPRPTDHGALWHRTPVTKCCCLGLARP